MRLAGIHRRILIVAMVMIAPSACVGGVSSASASEHHPTGGFAPFADCPLGNPSAEECFAGGLESGEFTVGRMTVPVDRKVTLQGGLSGSGEEVTVYGAEDGSTLSKAELSVPGGLTGTVAAGYLSASLRRQFYETVSRGTTSVTMTTELARPASAIKLSTQKLIESEGVALQLPLRIKLNNPFLGNDCYIGSSTNPVVLNLTASHTSPPLPNKPIKGSVGKFEAFDNFLLITLTGTSLVDNAFAVPAVTGCGGSLSTVIDAAIDAELGLPARAGYNTAILGLKVQLGNAGAVLESE